MFNLKDTALSALNDDYVISVKTSLGPEIVIYDSQTPAVASDGALGGLVKVGVIARKHDGKQLYNYGGYPDTDWILTGAIIGAVGFTTYLLLRGLLK